MSRKETFDKLFSENKKVLFKRCSPKMQEMVTEFCNLKNKKWSSYRNKKVRLSNVKKEGKTFLEITIGNKTYYAKCFTGNSNSNAVLCLPMSKFDSFLKDNNVSTRVVNAYHLIHYGDGTKDGTGPNPKKTMKDMKLLHPKETKMINNKFQSLSSEFLDFSLLKTNNVSISGIMYIEDNGDFTFCTSEQIKEYAKGKPKSQHGAITSSILTIQPFTKNSPTAPNGINSVQIKLHNAKETINAIREYDKEKDKSKRGNSSRIRGHKEEDLRVIEMNKNKKHPNWNLIDAIQHINIDNLYVMKIDQNHKSAISNRKTPTKADIVIIESNHPNIAPLLKFHNFLLTEKLLIEQNIPYKIIPKTGISVKNGGGVTIGRYTRHTIFYLYPYVEDLCIASFYSTNKKDLHLNFGIKEQWCPGAKFSFNLNDINEVQKHKAISRNRIINYIESHLEIKKAIITGEGVFEEEYTAHYMLWDGILKKIDINKISLQYNNASNKKKNSIPIFQMSKNTFMHM